jgi:hypothetical protein
MASVAVFVMRRDVVHVTLKFEPTIFFDTVSIS